MAIAVPTTSAQVLALLVQLEKQPSRVECLKIVDALRSANFNTIFGTAAAAKIIRRLVVMMMDVKPK